LSFSVPSWFKAAVLAVLAGMALLVAPAVAQAPSDIEQAVNEFLEKFEARKYDEAIAAGERALRLAEAAFGPEDGFVGMQAHSLAIALRHARRDADAVKYLERALAIHLKVRGFKDDTTKAALRELADLYTLQDETAKATKLYTETIDKLRAAGGERSSEEAYYLQEFGQYLRRIASYELSEEMLRRALAVREQQATRDDLGIAANMNNLAGVLRVLGKHSEAELYYKRTIALYEKARGSKDPNLGILHDNLGVLYLQMGRFAEAEAAHKRALAILEERFGPVHVDVGLVVANLAELYRQQIRFEEAEPLFLRALSILRQTVAPTDYRIGFVLDNLGGLYREQGRDELARSTYELALATLLATHPPNHPEVGTALNNLGLSFLSTGRPAEAEKLLQRALKIASEAYGENHREVAVALGNMGEVHQALGRLDMAKAEFARAVTILERTLGPEHPMLVWPLLRLGRVELEQNGAASALEHFRRAARVQVLARGRSQGEREHDPHGREAAVEPFTGVIEAAWRARESGAQDRAAAAETFVMAQWATLSAAGAALTQLGARLSAQDASLSSLMRDRQDLLQEWAATDKRLTAAVSVPPDRRKADAEAALRRRLADIDARLAVIEARLTKDFPNFAALSSPKPLGIDEARALLQPAEVLVQYVVLREQAFAWVVTRDGARWERLPLTRAELARKVQALRCGLDESEWVGEAKPARCLSYLGATPSDGLLPFSTAIAAELYTALLKPFEAEIAGKQLLIVPSGPLTSLPFQVLVTHAEPVAPTPGKLAGTQWLILSHAISVLPSVASLDVLRRNARPSAAKRPFLGIGNPLLLGKDGDDRRAFTIQVCPKQTSPRELTVAAKAQAGPAASYFRGGVADLERLKHLEPLPETAEELCGVAERLGATQDDVLLGAKANETELRERNAKGLLAGTRVIHFATHGLVSGELRGLAEPALVLSPPETVSENDDGLLTASEVATLKLDAEWVILSACNTAAGDALGAEALSGLARSFFYAGARSLLVSHWPVRSLAAVRLTTHAIGEIRQNPAIGRAEALRRSMVALMQERSHPGFAHPQIWAPFVVVGEGGASADGAQSIAPATASIPQPEGKRAARKVKPKAAPKQPEDQGWLLDLFK
jgi:CHAT domain-containing protein/tetratricopeptide (TPR) repeat protein